MMEGDLIRVRGMFLKHMYIPTGIKWELFKFGANFDWKEQVFMEDQ